MPGSPMPWLADLPDEWVPQTSAPLNTANSIAGPVMVVDSCSQDVIRRGSVISMVSDKRDNGSLELRKAAPGRQGLAQLDGNSQNARAGFSSIREHSAKGTVQSIDSVVRYDTVERQSSPTKKDAEMEWKRRLVDGDLGYGDQTDLFGPSGLENIFQSPSKPNSAAKSRLSNLKNSDTIPSSPPPWPPVLFKQRGIVTFPSLSRNEEQDEEQSDSLSQMDTIADGSGQEIDDGACLAENIQFVPAQQDDTNITDRKISGQTEIGNETFSPVFISKHTTMTGEINYTPLDSETARMLQTSTMMDSRAAQTQDQDPSASCPKDSDASIDIFDESTPQVEVSLPENLPTGTPPVSKLGNFVTVHRGGLSNYGSFKTRPLSPSGPDSRKPSVLSHQVIAPQLVHRENSPVESSPRYQDHTQTAPQTPTRDNVSTVPELPTPRSSGSPLKLFGVYDTFTNRKLLRRLSQLKITDETSGSSSNDGSKKQLLASIDAQDPFTTNGAIAPSALQNFGEHEIDEIDFEANISFPSEQDQDFENQDDQAQRSPSGSPEPGVLPPGAMSPFLFQADNCDSQEAFGVKRKLSDRSTNRSRRPESSPRVKHAFENQKNDLKEGSQQSPTRPTPKRQRTLHQLDCAMNCLTLYDDAVTEYQDSSKCLSSPTVVSTGGDQDSPSSFQTRPRNPTPSQQRYDSDDEIHYDLHGGISDLRTIRDKIEESSLPGSIKLVSQAKAVASEVAAFTLNVAKHDTETGERKRSITTQDFLDEAMHIMSLIRARGRPSGLNSVEESNEDSSIIIDPPEPSEILSPSILRVSRPPSREGTASGWRPRSQPNQDPKVENQLKKFQERDDMEILDATIHSLKLKGLVQEEYSELSDGSPSAIRISGPIQQESEYNSDIFEDGDDRPDSVDSHISENYSTGRTQGTSSTHKSDNVATLAPETVAHLIPEEVGGMTFDRTLGKWVRLRPRRSESYGSPGEHQNSNLGSDDDPFNNIPDLTVDEIEEIGRIRLSQMSKNASLEFEAQPERTSSHNRQGLQQDENVHTRPVSGHSKAQSLLKSSTNAGRPLLDSNLPNVETSATSWATEQRVSSEGRRDIDLDQSVTKPVLPSKETSRANVVQSPLPGPTSFAAADLRAFSGKVPHTVEDQESEVEELPLRQQPRAHGRKVSFQARTFQRRYGPELDQSEVSIVAELPDRRLMSVSVAVSRPIITAEQDRQVASYDPPEHSSLILSDLPDFTLAEIDRYPGTTERNLAATVAHHGLEVEDDRYALAVQDLVKTLTDVKGDEPFWEDIKQLNLREQSLKSLHGLQSFCTRLQQLDVSGNALAHLEGMPYSMRWLNASHNALTSLTSWNCLMNLQYLDISHNLLTSLDGLGSLVHLRELKADHNKILSMTGLRDLDGLLKLDVSYNEISSVDFSHFNWIRLEDINLSNNLLAGISSLSSLMSLQKLVLDNNKLSTLDFKHTKERPSRLQHLSLAGNQIRSLDLTPVLALRYLDLDGNCISSLSGLSSLKQLDLLSLRQQTHASTMHSIWEMAFSVPIHARTVNLSGNTISDLVAISCTQNTVSNLELSSCGLLSLPSDFGLHFPNLHAINLNFNALKDMRALLNIQRLAVVSLAGNRLSRLRKCIEALSHLSGLKEVDLRDNPFNLGFYAALGTEDQALVRKVLDQKEYSLEAVQRYRALPYTLPGMSATIDAGYKKTLDEDTRLRRRVYEILLVSGCKGVAVLDGLAVDRQKVLERDAAWHRLRELGVLKPKSGDNGC
ncbi:hypothetical protein ANO11243_030240 [Dothideomycetidae sp. 11243]|nr:hypothetical protein ANO11243_030240 [fungal sp. No.11243]